MKRPKAMQDALVERVQIHEFDGDEIILSVDSFTVKDKKYMVVASFTSGTATCDCMDARCRSKIIDFTDGTGYPCKHLRAAAFALRPFYEAALKGIVKVSA